MAENSKSAGDAAAAFNRHFDQQRAAQGSRVNHQQPGPSSFRGRHHNLDAESDFLNNQLGDLSLEQGNTRQPNFFHPTPPPQHLFTPPQQSTYASIDEAALAEARMNSAFTQPTSNFTSETASSSSTVVPNYSPYGHQHEGPLRYSHYQHSGYMSGPYSLHTFAPAPTAVAARPAYQQVQQAQQRNAAEPTPLAVAAAWEGAFDDAMDEWMQEQVRIEADEASAATEAEAAEAEVAEAKDAAPALPSPSDLAKTAQLLVSAVENDDSDKFRNSSFMHLMRRIAAQEVVIEDNNFVTASPAEPTLDVERPDKGKGKAVYPEKK
ncbi:hypothetical protein PFICI_14142 [Pestalotiopsis fici W106-1]|uniref:Peroxin 20 n=1 Tax=Pestalotiopsis fici (strain W106-1 / CGMCC3.15140) TaxID=1229662 RepID=W3WN90_PESFW|nr:uncharacterized protein PFICI_14142 [Pestalotiopsis fici W106-1]ETS74276.1 hypothetical protein PFICI_14142 [Pestalotiopsis fici W106-1]